MIIYSLDLLGVAVFALSGAIAAGRKELDWVGVLFLAVATALGGGTLRDLLLNRETVFWVEDPTYLWVIVVTVCIIIVCSKFFKPPTYSLRIADALGLALFTIIGAQVAEAEGASALIVIVMAVLTGAAGGVIRDVLTSEIPMIFRASEPIYSVTALSGAILYVLLQEIGTSSTAASLCGMALVFIVRMAAIVWSIRLPKLTLRKH